MFLVCACISISKQAQIAVHKILERFGNRVVLWPLYWKDFLPGQPYHSIRFTIDIALPEEYPFMHPDLAPKRFAADRRYLLENAYA